MAGIRTTDFTAEFTARDVRQGVTETIALQTLLVGTFGKDPAPLTTTPEWVVSTFPARRNEAVIEGADPGAGDFQNTLSDRGMLKGRFQRQQRLARVTKEGKLMDNQYTIKDILAHEVMTFTKVLYVDVEVAVSSDAEAVAPVAGATGSKGRGVFRWLSQANGRFTDSATTPAAQWRTPAANIIVSKALATDVTEPEVTGLITAVATARRQPSLRFMGVCTPLMRDVFDNYSRIDKGGSTSSSYPISRFAQKQGAIDRTITRYTGSNGTVELHTSFDLDPTVHFGLLTPELIRLAYAQPVKVSVEGASASYESRMIDVIYVTKMLNPAAHGKIITGATA